ncbi:MAG: DUF371 domain-containing protein [Thermofilum sp.]|nr:DUF371 domain-containing protein [Thermofilum sp.]
MVRLLGKTHIEIINAKGHSNIRATHKTTMEITRDPEVTPRGDCIIGVKADKAAKDLTPQTLHLIKTPAPILIIIYLPQHDTYDHFYAHGNPNLNPTHPASIVIRKSNYIDPRTIATQSQKAANDLPQHIKNHLKNLDTHIQLIITHPNQTPQQIIQQIKNNKT